MNRGSLAAKIAHGTHHGKQGFLRHILGVFGVAAHLHAKTKHPLLMPPQKFRQRRAVAATGCGEQ